MIKNKKKNIFKNILLTITACFIAVFSVFGLTYNSDYSRVVSAAETRTTISDVDIFYNSPMYFNRFNLTSGTSDVSDETVKYNTFSNSYLYNFNYSFQYSSSTPNTATLNFDIYINSWGMSPFNEKIGLYEDYNGYTMGNYRGLLYGSLDDGAVTFNNGVSSLYSFSITFNPNNRLVYYGLLTQGNYSTIGSQYNFLPFILDFNLFNSVSSFDFSVMKQYVVSNSNISFPDQDTGGISIDSSYKNFGIASYRYLYTSNLDRSINSSTPYFSIDFPIYPTTTISSEDSLVFTYLKQISSSSSGGSVSDYQNGYDNGYNAGYLDGSSNASEDSYNNGYSVGYSAGESTGYNNGYSAGVTTSQQNSYNAGYNQGKTDYINSGYNVGYSRGYDVGYSEGNANSEQQYNIGKNDGYNLGYNQAIENDDRYSFASLLTSAIDVPVNTFRSLFTFDILGVNLSGFFLGLLTCCIVITIVKKVV